MVAGKKRPTLNPVRDVTRNEAGMPGQTSRDGLDKRHLRPS